MILDIPFYVNNGDGKQCMQVAMQCVIKHFLRKEYSLDQLDQLTNRKSDYWTFTAQIVTVLYDLGLDVKYYSNESLELFLGGEVYFRQHFGKDADKILSLTDMPAVISSINSLLKYNLFEKKSMSLLEIEEHLNNGHVPLVLMDYNKIIQKKGLYQGHFVVVTGFDDGYIYYHESGPKNPEPNKKIRKELFQEAIDANGTDNDVVVVFGCKQ